MQFTIIAVSNDNKRAGLRFIEASDIDEAARVAVERANDADDGYFVAGVVQTDLRGHLIDGVAL